MNQCIDILTRESKCYTFESYAARNMLRAFHALNQEARLISLEDYGLSNYVNDNQNSKPRFILIFEDLDPQEMLLCDLIRAPIIFWSSGQFAETIAYARSCYAQVASIHRDYSRTCSYFFLPPSVDGNLMTSYSEERPFDAVMFTNLIDNVHIKNIWKDLFPEKALQLLEDAITTFFKNNCLQNAFAVYQAYPDACKMISRFDFLCAIENYVQSTCTVALIGAFQGSKLAIFGDHLGNNWLKRLGHMPHIRLHSALPYTEQLAVMKQSKIVISKPSLLKDHGDLSFLTAAACGALPLTTHSLYLEEIIGENSPLFYNEVTLSDRAGYFLNHPNARREWVDNLQKNVLREHSWKRRAQALLTDESRFFSRK